MCACARVHYVCMDVFFVLICVYPWSKSAVSDGRRVHQEARYPECLCKAVDARLMDSPAVDYGRGLTVARTHVCVCVRVHYVCVCVPVVGERGQHSV